MIFVIISSVEVDARPNIGVLDPGAQFSSAGGYRICMVNTALSEDQLKVIKGVTWVQEFNPSALSWYSVGDIRPRGADKRANSGKED